MVDTPTSSPEQIEVNKDKLDLEPNVDFISQNLEQYEDTLKALKSRKTTSKSEAWANNIQFNGTDGEKIFQSQVTPELARILLARMPESLIRLSKLKSISYDIGVDGKSHKNEIPVPEFDEAGVFTGKLAAQIHVNKFPRPEDHPSRILIGVTKLDGTTIYPTPIPPSVSEDTEAVMAYQIHVFLHEFFHTSEISFRESELRKQIFLEDVNGAEFNLQDWWEEWENLILSGEEPELVSSYAETYASKLTQKQRDSDPNWFEYALAEQICESFVAYQLGIISNNSGWTDFRGHSFGNEARGALFLIGHASSANLKWELMNRLCSAKVISS